MLVTPPMASFKMTIRPEWTDAAFSPIPGFIAATAHWLSVCVCVGWGGLAFGQESNTHPPPVAGIQNKADFPLHQPGLLTGFLVASSQTLLLVTNL